MKDDEKNREPELKDEKDQKPKLKKHPLQVVLGLSLPVVLIGIPLAFIGVSIENPQTIVDDIIFYTGVTSISAGTLGAITAHILNCFTKAEEAFDEKESPDEQKNEPFPEFEEKDNNERNLF